MRRVAFPVVNMQRLQKEAVTEGKLFIRVIYDNGGGGEENSNLGEMEFGENPLILKAFHFGKCSLSVSIFIFLRSKSYLPKAVNLSIIYRDEHVGFVASFLKPATDGEIPKWNVNPLKTPLSSRF